MPTLDWIGKKAVENHHKEVPYRLLKCIPELSVGESGSSNLLVQGDNLEALKALLPYYGGKVKCTYIDPPYNTGDENWVYNDAVNSLEMKNWLGAAVGRDDLSRHDKWLCMMYPRLLLLRQFMSRDGVLFVSIDVNEESTLRLLLDEIFGRDCLMEKFVWKSRQYPDSRSTTGISGDHEYILAYSAEPGSVRLRGRERDSTKFKNPDKDPRGPWMSRSILGLATKERRPNLHYPLKEPISGRSFDCPPNTGWRYAPDTMAEKIAEERILFPKKNDGRPREKVFLRDLQTKAVGFPSIVDGVFTADGSQEIRDIFGAQVFPFPKPSELIKDLIYQCTEDGDIVLDSFAGSGTTGHAVLKLNAELRDKRRFILVEMDASICEEITAKRLEKCIRGFSYERRGKTLEKIGYGGSFHLCKLGQALFESNGSILDTVKFSELAHHIFFAEMREPLPGAVDDSTPLLGVTRGTAVYLLYNGVLKDEHPKGGNVLTMQTLKSLPPHHGAKVVYGTACTLGERTLRRHGVAFRQIPYEVNVS